MYFPHHNQSSSESDDSEWSDGNIISKRFRYCTFELSVVSGVEWGYNDSCGYEFKQPYDPSVDAVHQLLGESNKCLWISKQ